MHDMTVKVKAWALPILEHNEQKYDYTNTRTHTSTCVIEYCAYAMLPLALSVFAVHARNKAGAAAGQANCCFKLINFVFISGKDNNNNNKRVQEKGGSFCFLILCFHLPLFLRYLPICASVGVCVRVCCI